MDTEPLDPQWVSEQLAKPPFVPVDGIYNVRDLGMTVAIPSSSQEDHVPTVRLRPGFVYRSGEVSSITEQGRSQLRALGIKKIFDLRSDPEIRKWNSELPSIEGVDVVRAPVFKEEDYSPEMMAKRYALYSSGKTEAFMELYTQILDHAGPAFGTVLRHVRDHPEQPFLFNCTAGKDRTGLLAALILLLAGANDETIAVDYGLTRVGREPARQMVMARLSKEALFHNNNQAALNMFTCRPQTMIAFLEVIKQSYGGAERFCETHMGLTADDVVQIRSNLGTTPDLSHL